MLPAPQFMLSDSSCRACTRNSAKCPIEPSTAPKHRDEAAPVEGWYPPYRQFAYYTIIGIIVGLLELRAKQLMRVTGGEDID